MDLSRHKNRFLVIEAIRKHGSIPRIELVEATGLSAGTVSNITRELVDHGIVIEAKNAAEGRGRPRVDLRLNAETASLVGVFLFASGKVAVQITDVMGKLLHAARFEIAPRLQGEELAEAAAEVIGEAIASAGPGVPLPYAAGVSLFGTVDTRAGILHWLPPGEPKPVPMQAMLEERLGIPVFIDNDANIVARSEIWRGTSESGGKRHFLIIGAGIGLATAWDGTIQNGGRGVNPEFGHIKSLYGTDLPCLCGGTGCLVTTASIGGIVARSVALGEPAPRTMADLGDLMEKLAAKARAGDDAIMALFTEAGAALGIGLANLLNVSNPDGVSVIVDHPAWIELAGPAFREAIDRNVLGFLGTDFPIDIRVEDATHHPLGAVALVEERLFQRDPLPDWN